jgi:hypothetical protein
MCFYIRLVGTSNPKQEFHFKSSFPQSLYATWEKRSLQRTVCVGDCLHCGTETNTVIHHKWYRLECIDVPFTFTLFWYYRICHIFLPLISWLFLFVYCFLKIRFRGVVLSCFQCKQGNELRIIWQIQRHRISRTKLICSVNWSTHKYASWCTIALHLNRSLDFVRCLTFLRPPRFRNLLYFLRWGNRIKIKWTLLCWDPRQSQPVTVILFTTDGTIEAQ